MLYYRVMERYRDYLFLLYFITHIPISLLLDSQIVLPRSWYPNKLLDVVDDYITTYRDPMVGGRPSWFLGLCVFETFLQLPFFCVATYVFWKGVSKCQWSRLPMMLYSCHVVTTMIPIFFHLFLEDFSRDHNPGPRNIRERLTLGLFYLPYLVIPLLLLTDSLFSAIYTQKHAFSSRSPSKLKRKQH